MQLDGALRAEADAERADPAGAARAWACAGVAGMLHGGGEAGGGHSGASAGAVAARPCPRRVALRALGGVDRLCALLCGPEGRPPNTLRQAGPPRTLACVAGCLETALCDAPSPFAPGGGRADAAAATCTASLVQLLRLATAELRRSSGGGRAGAVLESEAELLPNLLLATTALARVGGTAGGAVVRALRTAGGIEALLALLDLSAPPAADADAHGGGGGGPSSPTEIHILALDALHAAGEEHPEKALALIQHAAENVAPQHAAVGRDAATNVQALRAAGRLARPLFTDASSAAS